MHRVLYKSCVSLPFHYRPHQRKHFDLSLFQILDSSLRSLRVVLKFDQLHFYPMYRGTNDIRALLVPLGCNYLIQSKTMVLQFQITVYFESNIDLLTQIVNNNCVTSISSELDRCFAVR